MLVSSMTSNKSGREVANQFIITDNFGVTYFQSYRSIIAKIEHLREGLGTRITLDEVYWDYSKTTGKYRNMFLGETKKETQAKINSGEYQLVDLN